MPLVVTALVAGGRIIDIGHRIRRQLGHGFSRVVAIGVADLDLHSLARTPKGIGPAGGVWNILFEPMPQERWMIMQAISRDQDRLTLAGTRNDALRSQCYW